MTKLESYDFVLKKLSKLKKWSKNSIRHPSLNVIDSVFRQFLRLFLNSIKDNEIDCSLWWVLCPLWVWKGFVIVGGIVGSISYCNDRDSNPETKTEFKAMLIALFIHSILLFFEILLCYQVNSRVRVGLSENQGFHAVIRRLRTSVSLEMFATSSRRA